jgi:NTP pyrophosphatase (non-canonical NTP hydrolase)
MTLNEYMGLASRTDQPMEESEGLTNAVMGMVGEAAETMEHMKKVLYQGHELDKEHLKEEAGDCLWYIAKLARYCGCTLEDIGQGNIDKLIRRYPDGFSADCSINRQEG